jgi:catechol 2,3-dioxygenase-like lactoylglutathione lyase family enzyme
MAPTVWYHVRDLEEGRRFYQQVLGFEELAVDFDEGWSALRRGEMEVGIAEGEPTDGGVACVDVADLKQEAEQLRAAGVEVGIVLELTGQMRLLDVFDPFGNRIQLAQELPD